MIVHAKTAIDILREKYNIPDNVSETDVLKYSVLRESYLKYLDSIMGIGNDDSYLKKVKLLEKVKPEHFVRVRLMDYFEIVKGPQHDLNKFCKDGAKYNFITCSMFNNGVGGKCDKADFQASEKEPFYTIGLTGAGAGYIFKQIEPFSRMQRVACMKLSQKMPNEKFNLELISMQINASNNTYSTQIVNKTLENLEIYIYDKNNTSSESLKN